MNDNKCPVCHKLVRLSFNNGICMISFEGGPESLYDPDRADAKDFRIAELEAELAVLRPWADVGKRAVREEWFFHTFDDDGWDTTKCMVCNKVQQQWPGGHAPDCPIPALLKQLKADNAS